MILVCAFISRLAHLYSRSEPKTPRQDHTGTPPPSRRHLDSPSRRNDSFLSGYEGDGEEDDSLDVTVDGDGMLLMYWCLTVNDSIVIISIPVQCGVMF